MPKLLQPDEKDRNQSGLLGRLAIGLIWFYQRTLSPALMAYCEQLGAFSKHRFGRAFWLTLSRLSRCHPLGSHGFDPVPDDAPNVGWRFWRLGDWAWTERGVAQTQVASEKKKRRQGAAPIDKE
ncbi:MAG: membrane protein insertion efficiency factor [Pseudomonadota bacterium]